jgi:hypothetical protein
VRLAIDNVDQGEATLGLARLDICGGVESRYANAPGCPNVGWSRVLGSAVPGTHLLTVTSTRADGAQQVASSLIVVQAGPSSGALATGIAVNQFLQGTKRLGASIFDPISSPPPTVVVTVDHETVGNATVIPVVPASGGYQWSFDLVTTQFSNGPHTFGVTLNQGGSPSYCVNNFVTGIILNPATGTGPTAAASPARQYVYANGHTAAVVNGAH